MGDVRVDGGYQLRHAGEPLRRRRLTVMPRKNRSTLLCHDAEVGVKCMTTKDRFLNALFPSPWHPEHGSARRPMRLNLSLNAGGDPLGVDSAVEKHVPLFWRPGAQGRWSRLGDPQEDRIHQFGLAH